MQKWNGFHITHVYHTSYHTRCTPYWYMSHYQNMIIIFLDVFIIIRIPLTFNIDFGHIMYFQQIFQIIILYLQKHITSTMSNYYYYYYHKSKSKMITKIPNGLMNFKLTNLNHMTCIIMFYSSDIKWFHENGFRGLISLFLYILN